MSIEHGVGPQPAFAAPKSTGAGHGASRQSAAAAGGFAMLLSSMDAEQDIGLDTGSGMFAGGQEGDLQDALDTGDLASGLVQDEITLPTDDDEAASTMAAILNTQIPAEPSETLPLPQAVWATMQQQQAIVPAEAQQPAGPVAPGAGIAGDALTAKSAQAGLKAAAQKGQNGQAAQSETNPAATATATASAAAAQGARSKASVVSERSAQQITNAAAAAQPTTAQAAAPQAAPRSVSWTQRVAAAQQRAQGTEASKSSTARGGDAARASTQPAREASGTAAVQEWAAWADTGAARFERGGEFRPGATDWVAGGTSVTASAAPDNSIGGVRAQDGAPAEGGALPEMEVAEQVTYWVGRGARNASISVQGLTENPIRIRIAMEGQEASIQFLAEQEQTRQVLSEATPHLRELLEREGLTLGEVSVGSFTAQHPGGTGEREASSGTAGRGARSVKAAETEEVVIARPAPRASALPSGRSVDLFV